MVLSKKGWIKTIKGHNIDFGKINFKEGDELNLYLSLNSIDTLLIFANNGTKF